jgi:beta-glucanase (GH16 family)
MKPKARLFCPFSGVIALGLVLTMTSCGSDDTSVDPTESWILTMADEFDGAEGTPPNPAIWAYDIGGNGWGNGQLEFDTNRVENVSLDGQGNLRIVAREESFMGNDYTSARIKTENLFEQEYGRFEARIKLPAGQGIWPAFWMLGADFDEVGWPETGEIDIMEFRGQQPNLVYGSLHGPGYSGAEPISGTFRLPDGETFADDFHVFAVDWDPGQIRHWVDSEVYQIITTDRVSGRGKWVFDHPFFVLLNLAVGGGFVGPVGRDTEFPAVMLVDYVRIFERAQ